MGYKRPSTIYKLNFTDPDMEGLEVEARSLPLGKLMSVIKLAEAASGSDGVRDVEAADELFSVFCTALVRWNLEDEDGTPVPQTLDGLYTQDFGFALAIVIAWIDAIAGVSGPLDSSSDDGKRFPAVSIPMETLSPSRAS